MMAPSGCLFEIGSSGMICCQAARENRRQEDRGVLVALGASMIYRLATLEVIEHQMLGCPLVISYRLYGVDVVFVALASII